MHCTGPVALGILFYKIKIVFHNTKEFGNFMLHMWPFFMFWRLRYFNVDPESSLPNSSQWQAKIDEFSDSDFLGLVITSAKVYLVWAVLYFALIFVVLKNRISRKGHQTSFMLWFGKKGWGEAVILWTGLRVAQVIYISCHAVLSVGSLFVAILFLKYHEAYLCGLVVLAMSCVWFGSCYYFEEFSRDYREKVTQRVEKIKQSRMEMQKAPADKFGAVQDMVSEEKSDISLSDINIENYQKNLIPETP